MLESTRTYIGTRGHAQVGAVDVAMTICVGVSFFKMPLKKVCMLTMWRPVIHSHRATDRINVKGELLHQPVRRHLRIRIGKSQPPCTVRDVYNSARCAGLTHVFRIDDQNVKSQLFDDRCSVVCAAVQYDKYLNVFAAKLEMLCCQTNSAQALFNFVLLVVSGNNNAKHLNVI